MTEPDCLAYRMYGIAGAKRTPPSPSHLQNHRAPDRPHIASKNGNSRPSCELTTAGWSSKRPTGLSDEHTYLKPGKTKKDTRGEAYFVGEEERMQYLNKCDMEAIAAKKQVRREGPASAARHCVALEVAKSNTTAIPADHTASSPAESSQRRPHQLSATVSSPPPSLEKTSSGIVGVCPQDTTFHTASDLAASSQGSRISGRKRAQAFEESSEGSHASHDSDDEDGSECVSRGGRVRKLRRHWTDCKG
ncbi:hypothetical protein PC116_g14887 [Phytophthora cactorum]|uniref:Uncharacterized protein n=2 Tax=Phytophthora cactorum TaxID=29920 RepID=A0A8T0YX28_9STRA|nr:hypothetical protein PC111_g12017 [Phytophthora cactorum]KAG2854211.1 hypothetical protein PC113_g13507 [Phytophthora cactorum]KAG2898470.1 hypothetical protein PC114_g14265 [Phytophthora cactorum]KAG2947768.1 hypothetical protein PC117_g6554 [Phytophthora cactorum]KAG3009368.1 hypothetical protein PC119_g13913 [Phytophthora cactorum]